VGFKAPLWERRVEVNGAAFYYNYSTSRFAPGIADPFIGYLEVLDNVPKSRVIGAEAELIAHPVRGLDLSVSGSYLDSEVSGRYITTNGEGRNGDFNGSRLPYTPRFSLVSDAQYAWDVGRVKAFVGGGVTYNGKTQATFITSSLPAPEYQLGGYVLLDVRAGFGAPDDTWRVQFYGRNNRQQVLCRQRRGRSRYALPLCRHASDVWCDADPSDPIASNCALRRPARPALAGPPHEGHGLPLPSLKIRPR